MIVRVNITRGVEVLVNLSLVKSIVVNKDKTATINFDANWFYTISKPEYDSLAGKIYHIQDQNI